MRGGEGGVDATVSHLSDQGDRRESHMRATTQGRELKMGGGGHGNVSNRV